MCLRLATLFALISFAFCQERSSLSVESFLLRPIGARASGLSSMQVACADEPSALFSNPACLGYLRDSTSVTTGTTVLSFGRSLSNIAASFPVSGQLSIGAGIVGMNAGTITQRDQSGTAFGNRTLWQGYGSVAASYRLTEVTTLGIGGRFLLASAPDAASTGSGIALDAGVVTSVLDRATLGISIQHLGVMAYGAERFTLPWVLRMGICSQVPFHTEYVATTSATLGTTDTVELPSTEHILIGIEAQLRAGAPTPTVIFGAEIVPNYLVAVRGGIALYGESLGRPQLFPGTLLSGGVSFQLPLQLPIRLDYAIARGFTASPLHTLSLVADL